MENKQEKLAPVIKVGLPLIAVGALAAALTGEADALQEGIDVNGSVEVSTNDSFPTNGRVLANGTYVTGTIGSSTEVHDTDIYTGASISGHPGEGVNRLSGVVDASRDFGDVRVGATGVAMTDEVGATNGAVEGRVEYGDAAVRGGVDTFGGRYVEGEFRTNVTDRVDAYATYGHDFGNGEADYGRVGVGYEHNNWRVEGEYYRENENDGVTARVRRNF